MSGSYQVGLIGGRGYTGMSLLPLLAAHPKLALAFATSSSEAGQPLTQIDPNWPDPTQVLEKLNPEEVGSRAADVWILALPNGVSAAWVEAIAATQPDSLIVDLSADHRGMAQKEPSNNPSDWIYGLTEQARAALVGTRRVANPGCYATAAQLGLAPVVGDLKEPPVIFGVSGYSGAGKTPSPKNDPTRLENNLMPYQLTGHVHEGEISHQLAHRVFFHPHVAPFFRGLSVTIHAQFKTPVSVDGLLAQFRKTYEGERLVGVVEDIPEVRDVAGTAKARVGGFSVDGRDGCHATWVVVLDNLLKGAASQAIQNINVALEFDECEGLGDVM